MEHSNYVHLHWQELDRRRLLDAVVFSVDKSLQRGPGGRSAEYFLLNTPDWGNVVALTTDDQGRECFVMVRQFRHGTMQVCLEFPGGVIDRGEDPMEASAREFAEETGYVADELTLIGEIHPNPAFMSNSCYTYLARGLHLKHDQSLDENEVIDVELVPVETVTPGTRGRLSHAMMVVALHFFNNWRSSQR